ncbi:30S ribosomal protein S15 [Pseudobythopirellula maris]|uniref:Small ribosomal subunit protein uS15 n=1 Tax=Pseudobythopirellula maris TaxID=2527991 RepID=A0A5C5ZJP7_9BACT|nr:30S ribosomal protein S15 [Pseudobythopirellula maris]TWT87624.1 30S ribosomal protein S15 [Pseudobythopirellula maris]
MPLKTEQTEQLVQEFGREATDTGSPEVQIALLTSRIIEMTEHMKVHSKDHSSRRGLLRMVSRRRRLLDYVKGKNPQLYIDLLKRLGIRK